MDFTIHVPDEIGKKIKEQPDPNEFFVRAAQLALEDQMIAQQLEQSRLQGGYSDAEKSEIASMLAESQAQSERGEDATEEAMAFFNKWREK